MSMVRDTGSASISNKRNVRPLGNGRSCRVTDENNMRVILIVEDADGVEVGRITRWRDRPVTQTPCS